MQPFLIPTVTVALAELGDKTQLLAPILTAKYRRFGWDAFRASLRR